MATILVICVLILLAAAAVAVLRWDKKHGKSSCGGNCGCCANCGACHQAAEGAKRTQGEQGILRLSRIETTIKNAHEHLLHGKACFVGVHFKQREGPKK